jgi:hypothetical protein
MAKLTSLLLDKVEQQLDLQEAIRKDFIEEVYKPHYKYQLEERKATRMVHVDRKRQDYDRSNLTKVRKIKRLQRWEGVE